MHIYIDEAGVFIPEPGHKATLVAALIIPSSKKVKLFQEFAVMSALWPHEKGEIKGYKLQEHHIAQVVSLLHRHEALVEINAVDSGLQQKSELERIKRDVVQRFSMLPEPDVPASVLPRGTAAAYEKAPLQLFVQAFLMQPLIYNVIQNSISYYARRMPKELKHFLWLVDGKDKTPSKFDQAWSALLFPSLFSVVLAKPFQLFPGGDYSYLNLPSTVTTSISWQIMPKLDKGIKFGESHLNLGLQMVDVIANATRRALDGYLKEEGWKDIGSLIVERPLQALPIMTMEDNPEVAGTPQEIFNHPFIPIIKDFSQNNRRIHLDPAGEERLMKQSRRRAKKSKSI